MSTVTRELRVAGDVRYCPDDRFLACFGELNDMERFASNVLGRLMPPEVARLRSQIRGFARAYDDVMRAMYRKDASGLEHGLERLTYFGGLGPQVAGDRHSDRPSRVQNGDLSILARVEAAFEAEGLEYPSGEVVVSWTGDVPPSDVEVAVMMLRQRATSFDEDGFVQHQRVPASWLDSFAAAALPGSVHRGAFDSDGRVQLDLDSVPKFERVAIAQVHDERGEVAVIEGQWRGSGRVTTSGGMEVFVNENGWRAVDAKRVEA